MAGFAASDSNPAAPASWTRRATAIVALCFAINMADGIDVTILSFIAPRIQDEWGIGADVMGTLFSAGLLGMAIGGMFIAPLADRLGRKRIILAALVLMSTGMVLSGLVTTVTQLFVLRVIVGAGIGTALAAMAALAAESAPDHHRNLAVGFDGGLLRVRFLSPENVDLCTRRRMLGGDAGERDERVLVRDVADIV